MANRIVEKVRALLTGWRPVMVADEHGFPKNIREDIEELCDEAEALQDVNDRLMRVGDYAPKHDE